MINQLTNRCQPQQRFLSLQKFLDFENDEDDSSGGKREQLKRKYVDGSTEGAHDDKILLSDVTATWPVLTNPTSSTKDTQNTISKV